MKVGKASSVGLVFRAHLFEGEPVSSMSLKDSLFQNTLRTGLEEQFVGSIRQVLIQCKFQE